MPVSVHQSVWRQDLESYLRDYLASRPVLQKFPSVVVQGHGVIPPCRGEAVPLCCGSHVCTASGATERNGSQFVCGKQMNQLNVTVLLTMDSCMKHANPNYTPNNCSQNTSPNQMVFVRPLCTSIQFRKTLLPQNATH
jgi:hypothetical protein